MGASTLHHQFRALSAMSAFQMRVGHLQTLERSAHYGSGLTGVRNRTCSRRKRKLIREGRELLPLPANANSGIAASA
jgi:hypothetical protein